MKILHIVPHLRPSSHERDLRLVLGQPSGEAVVVCTLDDSASLFRVTGVTVEALDWRRLLDPRPLWRLARLVRAFKPDTVHAWGLAALRAFRLAAVKWRGIVVVNRPLASAQPLGALDRWLLRGADCILVRGTAEAQRCSHMGIAESRLSLVLPGVVQRSNAVPDRPHIVCAGALQPHNGFWDAIWTLDILHFVHEDIELVIAGDGPERPRLERFAASTGLGERVHFVGEAVDRPALLARAAVAWVPSRVDCGARVALEAMAAGLPVIASRWPSLAEVVVDGETGWLISPGDKMALARLTRRLLDDPALIRTMGEAGCRRAREQYSVERFVQSWRQAAACGDFCCHPPPGNQKSTSVRLRMQ
jgi:glycosyltransferase involved in cell wall biosynthesis